MNRRKAIILAGIGAAVLVTVWTSRLRIAGDLVDRRLSQAHVPASYRITRIGPFLERLENVRIGDPAAPDLIARRIDIAVGYGLRGPFLRGIDVQGARLKARIGPDGLSLGAIDRLLPASRTGGAVLPDLGVTLRDTGVTLDTPNGAMRAAVEGSGNPAGTFRGTAALAADTVRIASCRIAGVTADLRIAARSGAPTFTGPVRIGQVGCPGQALGPGAAMLAVSSDAAFETFTAQAVLGGFGGRAGPARFAGLRARARAWGKLGKLDGDADLTLHALSLPDAVAALTSRPALLEGTPVAPTAAQARAALAKLLGKAEAQARVAVTLRGNAAEVGLQHLAVTGDDGAQVTATARGGMRWSAAGWQADGDVATGGGRLPRVTLALRQAAPGAPLTATGALKTYRVGDAAVGAAPVRLRWDEAGLRFSAAALIDGPLANGAIRGLALPIAGQVRPSGAFAIAEGCRPIGFRALRLALYTFGPMWTEVCGAPIVARGAHGAVRIDATIAPIRLAGRSASGDPAVLEAGRTRITGDKFSVDALEARIGAPSRMTRLTVGALDGKFGRGAIGGGFRQTSAAIANVPLDLGAAAGTWALRQGALQLAGALQVRDAAPAARFFPLDAANATLRLVGGRVTARADLVEPKHRTTIAVVDIDHDLAQGSGRARFTVPGIRFAPKGLQPEQLTPLTLGVVADVAGTIAGAGRIAWGEGGVTSSGEFSTDRIDLAAAFGPVTGIRGELRFTDLLGVVSAPDQQATIAEMNPGVVVDNGTVRYQLTGADRVRIQDARWPFAGGTLRLEPTVLDFGKGGDRRLTFRVEALDAAAFIQQLDYPNIAATGIFDGRLPMIFDETGGRVEDGSIVARPGGGSLAYVGELSNAELGTMGKLAFDALKAIRYSALDIALDGRLDGEMISRVRFTGVREETAEQSLATRLIRRLPFRFNITIRAPFRGLVGSARAYIDPRLLLSQLPPAKLAPVQPSASGAVP